MEAILAHCTAVFAQHGTMLAVFFVGGLTGSLTHCLPMCGPVVMAQTTGCAKSCGSACGASRGHQRGLASYHIGRMLTYGLLGALAAGLSSQIQAASWWPALSAAMLIIAGVLFLASSLPGLHGALSHYTPKLNFARGLLLGFLPCGLVYAALMMAATLADPLAGMAAMWLFALGTMPALMAVHLGARSLSKRYELPMYRIGRVMMACNGMILLAMAGNVVR